MLLRSVCCVTRPSLSGAVVAMPWIVGGLLALRRPMIGDRTVRLLLGIGIVYVFAVLVTQERHAGGGQWGGRYLMLAIPALVPVAVVVIRRSLDAVSVTSVRIAGGVFVVIALMATATTVLVLAEGRARVNVAVQDWSHAASGVGSDGVGDRPVMLSPDSQLGRFAWDEVDAIDFFMIPSSLDRYVERYTDQHPEQFIFMGPWTEEARVLFARFGYEAAAPTDSSGSVDLTVVGRIGVAP